ncbi:hypothetical protein COO60DRAFT_1542980, partial [Scenedesmus sp. NREL 46B-D3]
MLFLLPYVEPCLTAACTAAMAPHTMESLASALDGCGQRSPDGLTALFVALKHSVLLVLCCQPSVLTAACHLQTLSFVSLTAAPCLSV